MAAIVSRIRLATPAVFLIILTIVYAGAGYCAGTPEGFEIIPKPRSLRAIRSTFTLSPSTVIAVPKGSAELRDLGRFLAGYINGIAGYTPAVRDGAAGTGSVGRIVLAIDSADTGLGEEGYRLRIESDVITISAQKDAGVFYGIQSLRQILMTGAEKQGRSLKVPGAEIDDRPAFPWRGMLLDCSRHFMTVDFIKRYIDLLAFHKMNVFHWHLTDDQGWRLEIKRYPKLTEVGAWRGSGPDRYGGFYTQDEAREIVAYAKRRHITVVPEIEMPGHATAALAAYPEISCDGKKIDVETTWGIHRNLFCAGKEATFEFMENVLAEICDIFPSEYIHIGGDEAKKDSWQACPDCQKRIADEGLEDENALQGYFTRRIDAYVQTLGRKIIGWDEILEGGPSQTAVVQSWRGMEGALEGTKEGHHVISSPHTHTYFDYPILDEGVHVWWMLVTPLEKNYSFEPAPDELTPAQKELIMGGECTIWSERSLQPEIDHKVFPRLCSFSEVVWTERKLKDFADFSGRMDVHYRRLDTMGIDYFTPSVRVGGWEPSQMSESPKTLEWDISRIVKAQGYYLITLRHDEGENGIVAEWAALMENGREIARDTHYGTTGKRNEDQNYRLAVKSPKKDAKYTLTVGLRTEGGTDSKGTVLLRHFSER